MYTCPVCDNESSSPVCPNCSFDSSCNYEQRPTLTKLTYSPDAVSRHRTAQQHFLKCGNCGSSHFQVNISTACAVCANCNHSVKLDTRIPRTRQTYHTETTTSTAIPPDTADNTDKQVMSERFKDKSDFPKVSKKFKIGGIALTLIAMIAAFVVFASLPHQQNSSVNENNQRYDYENGEKVTGWQTIEGKRYYFNSDGTMETGWKEIGLDTYYFTTDGSVRTGWCSIDGNTYYFNESGVMQTGTLVIDDVVCTFNSDGVLIDASYQ